MEMCTELHILPTYYFLTHPAPNINILVPRVLQISNIRGKSSRTYTKSMEERSCQYRRRKKGNKLVS